jgi:uncharacterized protein DUF3987
MPRGRPRKVVPSYVQGKLDFGMFEQLSLEAQENIRALVQSRPISQSWRGLIATPPGSLLYRVVQLFSEHTDFPLELPFFQTVHFLSGYLLSRDVSIKFAGKEIRPDCWTVLLAESGSGKTETKKFLEMITAPDVRVMPESTSALRFIQDLYENNRSLLIMDEFAQTLKRMETQSYAQELREYFLKLYDGQEISRRTGKAEIVVKDPALTILGMNVPESFLKNVSAESMLDGFAQRFSYVIARRDPSRDPRNFPIYHLFEHIGQAVEAWCEVKNLKLHKQYCVSKKAEQAYIDAYKLLFPANNSVPISFFRRIMWRSVRYALVYHIALLKDSDEIDSADMEWAAALTMMHIEDARQLLGNYGLSEFETLIRKAERLRDNFRVIGKNITVRDLISGVREIRNKNEALAVMSFL